MYPRLAERQIAEAMHDTRVVMVTGPRQAGKTTLVQRIVERAHSPPTWFTLDDATVAAAARADPVGFVRGLDRAVIDEIQRVPSLLPAIKESVDRDPRPGRFLLTGSANLMTLPTVSESLAGRMEIVRLLPLTQAEIRGTKGTFLEDLFEGRLPSVSSPASREALIECVLTGGLPEAVARKDGHRRQRWLLNYVDAVIRRDVRDVAEIEHASRMPRLLRVLAHHAAQLANHSEVGKTLGLSQPTARRYAEVLETLFVLHMLEPWHTNRLKRLVKTPKVQFYDSGLLAALLGANAARVSADRSLLGPILEVFVFAEVAKLAALSPVPTHLYHYRDHMQIEVDLVAERQDGVIIGIEVKAAATIRDRDLNGLRKLRDACGDAFAAGVVLYDHDRAVPFGDRLHALPLSALWA